MVPVTSERNFKPNVSGEALYQGFPGTTELLQMLMLVALPCATRLMAALCVLLPKLAVTVADWLLPMVPLVAVNVFEVDPAATVTDVGTVNRALLLDNDTVVPPDGAAWFRVIVQVLEALGPKLVGLQDRPVICVCATKLMAAFCVLLPKLAVTVADWLLPMVPLVAVNVFEVDPAATVSDVGTVNRALLLDNDTVVPPDGAAWFRVTVQVLEALDPRLAGLQESAETWGRVAPPVTTPPVAENPIAVPEGDEPRALLIPIEVLVAPTAIVRFTTATTPLVTIPAFIPETMQE